MFISLSINLISYLIIFVVIITLIIGIIFALKDKLIILIYIVIIDVLLLIIHSNIYLPNIKNNFWHVIKKNNLCILESPKINNTYTIYAIKENSNDPELYITGTLYTKQCLNYHNCNIPLLINYMEANKTFDHHYYQLQIHPVNNYKLNKLLGNQVFKITNLTYNEFVNFYERYDDFKIPVQINSNIKFKKIRYMNFNKALAKFSYCN